MHPISVSSPSPGTARLAWGSALPQVEELRALLGEVLAEQHRAEVHLRVEDKDGIRLALWAGMRREGVARGVSVAGQPRDLVVLARLATDPEVTAADGFRGILNSFLPRKRVIGQVLVRDAHDRVLMCQLTYKPDWDLPGGVVEVGENPRLGTLREVGEELALDLPAPSLLLADWMPAWSGWDDAVCLVFDGGVHAEDLLERVVREEREIRSVAFLSIEEVRERAADFTARRVEAALAATRQGSMFTESGRPVPD